MGSAFIWQIIVIAMLGYLIGSVNLSIILSHLMGKGDIRNPMIEILDSILPLDNIISE